MQPVADVPKLKISFDYRSKTLIVIDTNPLEISDEQIRQMVQLVTETIRSYKPIYYLTDNTMRKYTFGVEMLQWIAESLLHVCLEVGLQKFAVVQPLDPIAGLSNEQVAEQITDEIPIQIGFFCSVEEACQWLNISIELE